MDDPIEKRVRAQMAHDVLTVVPIQRFSDDALEMTYWSLLARAFALRRTLTVRNDGATPSGPSTSVL